MSLNSALNSALSGLTANSRAALLVSTNIANASTDGYVRRDLALSSPTTGFGGVRIDGVTRFIDPAVLSDRRVADAGLGYADTMTTYTQRLESAVGTSNTQGSLSARIAGFENALITAAGNPASPQRLESVAIAGRALAQKLNDLTDSIQTARNTADASIADQVQRLNSTLVQIDTLNDEIVKRNTSGGDVSSQMDTRQQLIDSISDIVPLRVVQRDKGTVALFSTGGAILLDGAAAKIGFQRSTGISAGDSLANGDLSALSMNGIPLPNATTRLFEGGTLAANFAIRDVETVEQQAQLDALARDLTERLGPGGPDTTLAANDPGLFTDGNIAFDPVNETGLAGRISLNALVAPGSGNSWRLRDGMNALVPGEVGEARLLQGISEALSVASAPASTALGTVARSFSGHSLELTSTVVSARIYSENQQSYQAAQHSSLRSAELSLGVDTDAELQKLLRIEQQFAANARVMSVVDDLMQTLINI